ncbi:hypothetical protein PTTG_29622 [Puccinia triticina 1-1 BBBD Race 1]|uniref:Chromo domain-containing protein n=2 Tax=Puccinia triticina TaxID=208348 RepID=A0A180G2T0_PUCT1|nr:uncharacterized protein PtA15_1A455 [Puccinia triticina]OAV87005.1 hypothetical protein PTTG_29622 [Puccinia triticina 1-1 BBBD Race 1]WAQ81117.1 hypothetical protein PtA15_1A455 [Puccinia triticina]WAR52006.1 hypothetical protein PtB15_1B445 [Puccinia triticina]
MRSSQEADPTKFSLGGGHDKRDDRQDDVGGGLDDFVETARLSSSLPTRLNDKQHPSETEEERRKKRKSQTIKSYVDTYKDEDDQPPEQEEELFVVDKIIGESGDISGETIYKVLWAGYPESEATWQFANTLDNCAALDVWQQNKDANRTLKIHEDQNAERNPNGLANPPPPPPPTTALTTIPNGTYQKHHPASKNAANAFQAFDDPPPKRQAQLGLN